MTHPGCTRTKLVSPEIPQFTPDIYPIVMSPQERRFEFELSAAGAVPFAFVFLCMSPRFGIAGGVLAAALLLASLLAHEAAHIFIARVTGTRVSALGICLWGAYLRRARAPGAVAEIAIAVAGPAMNLAIAILLWNFGGVLFWVAQLNGLLFIVNIVPAMGSDGQRIVQTLRKVWYSRAIHVQTGASLTTGTK